MLPARRLLAGPLMENKPGIKPGGRSLNKPLFYTTLFDGIGLPWLYQLQNECNLNDSVCYRIDPLHAFVTPPLLFRFIGISVALVNLLDASKGNGMEYVFLC
jgi:hypothetical protein